MLNFTQGLEPTRVKTTPPKISKADIVVFEAGLAELARIDGRMREIDDLRDLIREAARAYAAGEIGLVESVGLAGIDPARVPDVRGALRAGCKKLQRELVAELAVFVQAHRRHAVDDLADRCRKMENGERENAAQIGIGPDDYRPSGMLLALREQHLRAKGQVNAIITRQDLRLLAEACDIAVPVHEADPEESAEV